MVGFYAWQMAKCIIYSLHTESDLIICLDDLSLSLESAFEISLQGSFELLFVDPFIKPFLTSIGWQMLYL